MFRSLRTAIGFLTVLPLGPRELEADDLGQSVAYFPLVGAIYGLATWAVLSGLRLLFPVYIAAWLTVFAIAFLNGGIHWDGFADTADGFGGKDPEKRLAIMKDSRLGAFGGMALFFLIGGKIFILANLTKPNIAYFIIISSLARWVISVQICTQPSVSRGLLACFQVKNPRLTLGIASLFMALLLLWALPFSLGLLGLALILMVVLNYVFKSNLGGITGDVLGASCEFIELICLLSLTVKGL